MVNNEINEDQLLPLINNRPIQNIPCCAGVHSIQVINSDNTTLVMNGNTVQLYGNKCTKFMVSARTDFEFPGIGSGTI